MSKESYTIEAAAGILGVPEERLHDLIKQRLVDAEDVNGEQMLSKSAIMVLFDNVTPDPSSTDPEVEKAREIDSKRRNKAEKIKGKGGVIVVEAQELIDLYDEMTKHVNRVNSLIAHCQRVELKIKSHKKQALGHDAEFHDLAVAHFPELTGKPFEAEKLDDGTLVLKPENGASVGSGDFKRRLNNLLLEGAQSGELPPGTVIGPIMPPPPGMGGGIATDEEDEDD